VGPGSCGLQDVERNPGGFGRAGSACEGVNRLIAATAATKQITEFTMLAAEARGGVIGFEAPHTSNPALDATVILLQPIIQIGACPVPDRSSQCRADCSGIGAMASVVTRLAPDGGELRWRDARRRGLQARFRGRRHQMRHRAALLAAAVLRTRCDRDCQVRYREQRVPGQWHQDGIWIIRREQPAEQRLVGSVGRASPRQSASTICPAANTFRP
jgi:hypothetical protein